MKNLILFSIVVALTSSCKNETIEPSVTPVKSTVEIIADSAGITKWNDITRVAFTFEVGKMGRPLYARQWTWNKQTGDVTLIAPPDTVHYNRYQPMDSIQISADRAFTNDLYWLIPEFKFASDQGVTITEGGPVVAPISKDSLPMFTVLYGNEGGYTPGDAYDVYYDKDYKLREWVYRKDNDTVIYMMNTFEEFETYNGITIARDHRTPDRMTRVYLRDIKFEK